MSAALSLAQVSEHNQKKDLYVAIHNKVYNITEFVEEVSPLVPPPTTSSSYSPLSALDMSNLCSSYCNSTLEVCSLTIH